MTNETTAPEPLFVPLAEIVAQFTAADRAGKIALLLDYATQLPAMPDSLPDDATTSNVPECATPVNLSLTQAAGGLEFRFAIPETAPALRGMVAVLGIGLRGAAPEAVFATPDDLFQRMGLHTVLPAPRLYAAAAVLHRMKQLAAQEQRAYAGV